MLDLNRIPDQVDLNSEEGMKWWMLCKPKINADHMMLDLTPLKDHLKTLESEHGPDEFRS